MYSTEEVKEQLSSLKLIGGEEWINIRAKDIKKIKNYIDDIEELSSKEILAMVQVSEEEVGKLEDLDLKLINNKITEKAALAERAALQKDLIEVLVKGKKGNDVYYIIEAKDLTGKEI